MSTFTKRIAANGDDGSVQYSGGWVLNSSGMYMGYYDGNQLKAWVRFTDVTIPNGATITAAKLTFRGREANSTTGKTIRIYGNDVDDATAPTDYTGFDALVKTTAYSTWSLPNVALNTNYDTADFKDVVKEIVDRASWASGNDMQFIIDTCSATSDMYKHFYDYNDSTSYGALLTIEYTSGTQYTKSLSGSINLAGNFIKNIGKIASSAINTTGNVTKNSTKSLSGSATVSGTVSRGMALLKTLQGAMNVSGLFSRSTNKVISALSNVTFGGMSRGISKNIIGNVNTTGNLLRAITKSISGAGSVTGNLIKVYAKELIASISASAIIFNRSINKALSVVTNAVGYTLKSINKKLSGTATLTATNTKSTHKMLTQTATLSATIEKSGATITINNAGTAPIGLGAQEGALFNIIVTGTYTSFTITLNGKTLTYTDNIVGGSVTIYNASANATDRSKLTGDTSEYLTLLAGDNVVFVTKVGGSVDFKFEYTPLYL